MYDTIIFDCDGTLSRSEDAYFHGFCDALTRYGFIPPTADEYQAKYSGILLGDILRQYGEEAGSPLPPEVEAHYWKLEKPYLDKYTRSVDGAAEAIDRLQERFDTCVASNAPVEAIKYLLKTAGLDGKFPAERLYSSEQVRAPKPAPDVFLHALADMKARPASTFIIEDSPGGVRAGVAAGVRVIGFAGTSHNVDAKHAELKRAGALETFATWPEITAFIERIS